MNTMKKLCILHIAAIDNYPFSGVCLVVPKYIKYQKEYAEVAFVNLLKIDVPTIDNQLKFEGKFRLSKLLPPFSAPDLVVIHEIYNFKNISVYHELKRHAIPYVVVPHCELTRTAQQQKRIKKMFFNFLFFNRFIYHSAGLQCLSINERDETHYKVPKFVCTNGVEIPLATKKRFNSDKIVFSYIGRLDINHKGLDLLLAAIKNLSSRHLEICRFDLYGPDRFGRKQTLENMVLEKGIGANVFIHGPLQGESKIQVLLNTDVFIQTSRFEGMPLGLLEALSYGVPCCVTKGTNLKEDILRFDAGWGCETSIQDITKTIERIVSERENLADKSCGAIKLVNSLYSWKTISKDTIDCYRRLVGK